MKMKRLLATAAALVLAVAGAAYAEGDLTRANIQTVNLEMGTGDDGMYFKADTYVFETGKAYKLHMVNVDDIKHELAFEELGEKMFTRKVEIQTPDGELVAEIKGAVHEIEVGPHQAVDWFFVPIQTGKGELKCEIEGHYEAGMHADIEFK